jgi:hypothetical protein
MFLVCNQRQSPAALTQIEDSVTNWNFIVGNGQTVGVGSDVLLASFLDSFEDITK